MRLTAVAGHPPPDTRHARTARLGQRGRRRTRHRAGRAAAAVLAAVALTGATAGGGPAPPAAMPGWPRVLAAVRTPDQPVACGITHHAESYDTTAGWQRVQVLAVDLALPCVRVGVVEAHDTVTDPADETLSSMADRTGAVAGVNGGYFDIHRTGAPLGGVISGGVLLKTPPPGAAAQLGVRPDGSLVMGPETYLGGVAGPRAARHLMASVNSVRDAAAGEITEVTPRLGGVTGLPSDSTLVVGRSAGRGRLLVDRVASGTTSLAALPAGDLGLLAAGDGGGWLARTVRPGDTLRLSGRLVPEAGLTELVSGVAMLVAGGRIQQDPTGSPPHGANPETAIGISRDGRRALLVTFDGRAGPAVALGVTPGQVAGYLVTHGAYTGELFDGGGSTEMVVRRPCDPAVSVANTPSDPGRRERPVADSVLLYSVARWHR